jgi:hypothetical protein
MVAPQNRRRKVGVGDASRSSGLLRVEVSQARVSQSGLKTGGGAMVDGAHGTIAKVAWSSIRRRMSRCDGLRRTLLPLHCHFSCIKPQWHSSLLLAPINRTL